MIDTTELSHKVYGALLAARERVLGQATTAELIAESRGAIIDHIDLDLAQEPGSDFLTIRTIAKTPHGAHIIAELEAATLDDAAARRSLH
jgi:hypothetical protein